MYSTDHWLTIFKRWLIDKATALLANITLGLQGLPGRNTWFFTINRKLEVHKVHNAWLWSPKIKMNFKCFKKPGSAAVFVARLQHGTRYISQLLFIEK
jgi:hypothetical protein